MKGMDQGRGQNVLFTYITCLRSNFRLRKKKISRSPEDRAPWASNTSRRFSFLTLSSFSLLWEWSQAEAIEETRRPNAPPSGLGGLGAPGLVEDGP